MFSPHYESVCFRSLKLGCKTKYKEPQFFVIIMEMCTKQRFLGRVLINLQNRSMSSHMIPVVNIHKSTVLKLSTNGSGDSPFSHRGGCSAPSFLYWNTILSLLIQSLQSNHLLWITAVHVVTLMQLHIRSGSQISFLPHHCWSKTLILINFNLESLNEMNQPCTILIFPVILKRGYKT